MDATPAAVADVEDALRLGVQLFPVVEVWVVPLDRVTHRRVETAFAHLCPLCRNLCPEEASRPAAPSLQGANLRGGVLVSFDRRAASGRRQARSEEHTSELTSLMRISYAV